MSDPEPVTWWRGVRHELAWLVSTHQLRLLQAFASPPSPQPRPPPTDPLPPAELGASLQYFGLTAGSEDPSGQTLFLASRNKCEVVHDLVWRAAGPILSESPDSLLGSGPELQEADWVSCVRPEPSPELEALEGKLAAMEVTGASNGALMRKAAMIIRMPLQLLIQEAQEAARDVTALDAAAAADPRGARGRPGCGRQPAVLAAQYVLDAARTRHMQLQLLFVFNFGRSLQRESLPAARLAGGRRVDRHCVYGASSEIPGTPAGMLTVVDAGGRPVLYRPAVTYIIHIHIYMCIYVYMYMYACMHVSIYLSI